MAGCNLDVESAAPPLALNDCSKQTSLLVTDSWSPKTLPDSQTKVICELQGLVLGELLSTPVSGGKG